MFIYKIYIVNSCSIDQILPMFGPMANFCNTEFIYTWSEFAKTTAVGICVEKGMSWLYIDTTPIFDGYGNTGFTDVAAASSYDTIHDNLLLIINAKCNGYLDINIMCIITRQGSMTGSNYMEN